MAEETLLLFSGGRDSFLSACRLITEGRRVRMVSFDNGCMSGTGNAEKMAGRIVSHFGPALASYEGIFGIAQDIAPFFRMYACTPLCRISMQFPHLLVFQLECLICHTIMVAHGIAYAHANGIREVSSGERRSQGFMTEMPEMLAEYEKMAGPHIHMAFPVWSLGSDAARKSELMDYGFLPKTYEMQCHRGSPLREALDVRQRMSLLGWYKKEMRPYMPDLIKNAEEVYAHGRKHDT